jgi:glycogen debranching enzyme
VGLYSGNQRERDGAYHQGTAWGWLIGPFVAAHYKVYQDATAARRLLRPFQHHLSDHGLGTLSEILAWFILGKTAPLQIKQATPYL